jgi:hypothetical protein
MAPPKQLKYLISRGHSLRSKENGAMFGPQKLARALLKTMQQVMQQVMQIHALLRYFT